MAEEKTEPTTDALPEPTAPSSEPASAPAEPSPGTAPEPGEPSAGEPPEPVAPAAESAQTVPLSAHIELRHRAQAAEDQVAALGTRLANLETGVSGIATQLAPAAPSREEDPLAWFGTEQGKLIKRVGEVGTSVQALQGQLQGQAVQHQVATMESQFEQGQPAYKDALQHLFGGIDRQLVALGVPDRERMANLSQYAGWITQRALQAGTNPAAAVYAMAEASGFAPAAAAAPGDEGATPAGPAEDKLATVARGVKASKTLASTGGNAPKPASVAGLDDLDDADFDKTTEGENWERLWKDAGAT